MASEQKNDESASPLKHIDAFGKEIGKRSYKEQGIFFLNAMWNDVGAEEAAEKVWEWRLTFDQLDLEGNQGGHDLDDFQAARFLEKHGQTMTVVERRTALKNIDVDNNKRMGLMEWLVHHYKVNIDTLMERPQGTNEEVGKAEAALKEVMNLIAAEEKKKADLQAKVDKGGVKGKMAYAELAQINDKDNMPLNRALISAEAALRKAQKSDDVTSMGAIWFMQRELIEAKKYKPNKKK